MNQKLIQAKYIFKVKTSNIVGREIQENKWHLEH